MWHFIIFGLLLGWGAAVPIGPINIEIIRRNLRWGTSDGVCFGLGACTADLTYFILLLSGLLVFLQQPLVLRVMGFIGSGILIWFGISALKMHTSYKDTEVIHKKDPIRWHNYLQGYLLTLLNPLTVLFWASLSTQLALLSQRGVSSAIYAGIGVLLGTVSWCIGINTVLHFTRHRLSDRAMRYLNCTGGVIILCFAAVGLWRAI